MKNKPYSKTTTMKGDNYKDSIFHPQVLNLPRLENAKVNPEVKIFFLKKKHISSADLKSFALSPSTHPQLRVPASNPFKGTHQLC